MLLIVPVIISVLALAFAGWLVSWIKKQDMGTAKMQEIYEAIKKGANAFLKRQYKTIAIMAIVLAAILYAVYAFNGKPVEGFQVSLAFLLGAFCSCLWRYLYVWAHLPRRKLQHYPPLGRVLDD